jgi:glucose-1-phosphatase
MEILSGIKNIIFDLGGVLLDLDFMAPVDAFRKLGAINDSFDYRKAISHPDFLNFELGNISPSEFRDRIREILGNNQLRDTEIDRAWCSMLVSMPGEKVELLKQLAPVYRLFLFSNTNAIHMDYFKRRFEEEHHIPIESLFEKTYYSNEIHDRKPLTSAFAKVAESASIKPMETLFVDDFVQNIEAARNLGFKILHYIPGTDLNQILGSLQNRKLMRS